MGDLAALVASPEAWIALATLIVMEVVLGIDNLVFVSIISNKLPEETRGRAPLSQTCERAAREIRPRGEQRRCGPELLFHRISIA